MRAGDRSGVASSPGSVGELDEPEVDEPEVDDPEVDEPEVDEPEACTAPTGTPNASPLTSTAATSALVADTTIPRDTTKAT
jgi:hypothetical protein